MAERAAARRGLTRPELAVLLAYAKMALYQELLPSDLPDDPRLVDDLAHYFPEPLRERYADRIAGHRLRREIIASVVTNSLVNRVGPAFVDVMREQTGAAGSDVARAYAIARSVFKLRRLWAGIQDLDNKAPAALQTAMLGAIGRLVEMGTLWFLRSLIQPLDIAATIAAYGPGVAELTAGLDGLVADADRTRIARRRDEYAQAGAPDDLARRIASLDLLAPALDIVRMARAAGVAVTPAARAYFAVGDRFGIDWLRHAAAGVPSDGQWDRMAIAAIVDDLYGHQREITTRVLGAGGNGADDGIETWVSAHGPAVQRTAALLADLRQTGAFDLAKLAVANRQLRSLIGE
ncbi:MAG: hypothetical protein WD014_07965 [Dongiaceae bacterium]